MARELQAETSTEKIWRITDGRGNFVKLEVEAGGRYFDHDEYVALQAADLMPPPIDPTNNVGVNVPSRARPRRRVDPLTVALSSAVAVVLSTVVNHLWR